MTSDAPDIHTMSGAYALDALEPAEAAAFERHLESCEACRDEVRSFREAVTSLGDDVAAPAPDRLRASVLASIGAVRPLPPIVPPDVTDGPADALVTPSGSVTSSPAEPRPVDGLAQPVDELAVRREARGRRTTRLLQAVAAVLALVAGATLWHSASLDRQLTAMSAAAADVTSVLTAPDSTTASSPVSGGGRAAVVVSKAQGRAVLVTDGLTPAPAGKTWQIWYIGASGTAAPAGFVPPGEQAAVALVGDPASAAAVGVTLEPSGGSAQPTTKPVLAVKV
jgi:anti-sigma-K factor RskA